jgi:hypothetical protein
MTENEREAILAVESQYVTAKSSLILVACLGSRLVMAQKDILVEVCKECLQ